MHVSALTLTNFRNYSDASVELPPGTTCLVGENGQGKTNFIEAVMYLATLASHRVASDTPLVQVGHSHANIAARVENGHRETILEARIAAQGRNRVSVNRAVVNRPRDMLGHLKAVLFAPEDLGLIKADPTGRRRFIDDLLIQLSPRFAGVKADYDRVLKQRNSLLKQLQAGAGSLDVLAAWDDQLVGLGSDIVYARLYTCAKLLPHLEAAYTSIAGVAKPAMVQYRSSALPEAVTWQDYERPDIESMLRTALQQRRAEEHARGVSVVGPHRDDLDFLLAGLLTKGYASHGESWSFALALRLASYWLLSDESAVAGAKDSPVLILDDVFAELDTSRRERLAQLTHDASQTLITVAVAADLPSTIGGTQLHIHQGTVMP